MKLFNTHTCEIYLYGENQAEQCKMETQTRCDTCRRWCCVLHREGLKRGLKKMVVLCSNCIPEPGEKQEEEA